MQQRKLTFQGATLDSDNDLDEDELDEPEEGIGRHKNTTDPDFYALASLRKPEWTETACVKATVNQIRKGARALALAGTRFANGLVKITVSSLSKIILGAATVFIQLAAIPYK